MSEGKSGNALELLARCGYAARGFVYCMVGGLSLVAAFGSGGGVRGSNGALKTLFAQPFGEGLLFLIAIGLIGFAIWRLVQALLDPDQNGTSWEALGTRCGYVIGSLIYFGLAATALNIAFGTGSNSDDRAAQDWTAWHMSQPYGPWITGAVAIGIGVAGGVFVAETWRGDVAKHIQTGKAGNAWIGTLARVGYAACGAVFVVIGALLMSAAVHGDPAEVRGLGGALATLQAQPYGSALLAVVAAGLFAYGTFGIVQGIYRQIDAPDLSDAENAVSGAADRLI